MAERCRDISEGSGESLAGTASRVPRWLLVETPGPWPHRDWTGCMPFDEAAAVHAFAERVHARVVLIRRPADAAGGRPRRFFWADTRPWPDGRLHTTSGDVFAITADDAPTPDTWPVDDGPLWLVCVHSTHDMCCGIHGRALVRAVEGDEAMHVWECSHIGGDRFAANVVELPTGIYYGRVSPEVFAAIPDAYRRGAIHLPQYRGRTAWGRAGQVAEIAVRHRFGLDGRGDVRVVRGDGDVLEVEAAGRMLTVRLESTATSPRKLTCKSRRDESPPALDGMVSGEEGSESALP